jgi:hypothetical protein
MATTNAQLAELAKKAKTDPSAQSALDSARQQAKTEQKERVAERRAAAGLTPITTEMRNPGESVTELQERGKVQAEQFASDYL